MVKKISKKKMNALMPISEQTWLHQPVVVTTMRQGYNATQNKAVAAIVSILQDSLQKVIDGEMLNQETLPLFKDHHFDPEDVTSNDWVVPVDMKEIEDDPRRWPEVKVTLADFSKLPVSIPIKDKNGKDYDMLTNFCDVIVPKKWERTVYFVFKPKVGLHLFNMSFGFHRYLKNVVFSTRNKYTQRFYMYISMWKRQGITPPMSISDFRLMLQLTDKYSRWNSFYGEVIERARIELLEKAESGQTDCYFDLDLIYKNNRSKRGEPDAIRFIIYQSTAGKEAADIMGLKHQKIKIKEFLKTHFMLSTAPANAIADRITMENLDIFNVFLSELNTKATQLGDKVKDLRGWAYKCCSNELDKLEELQREADAIRDSVIEEVPTETSEKVVITKKPELSEEEREMWKTYIHGLRASLPEDTYSTWIKPMELIQITKDRVVIMLPSKFFFDYVEEMLLDAIVPVYKEVFGRRLLSYNIKQ